MLDRYEDSDFLQTLPSAPFLSHLQAQINMTDHHYEMQHEIAAGDFSAHIRAIVASGLYCLSIGLGMETGLFDVMMSLGQPKTCQEIANAGKYKERYVEAWLDEMVTAQVVSVNPSQGTYWVPKDLWPSLRKDSKQGQSIMSTLAIPMLSEAFHSVKECVKLDGPKGVPPEQYSRFDRYISGRNSVWFNHYLVQSFLATVPGLMKRLEEGICVLDVACGEGSATAAMAKAFPKSQFYGFDISQAAVCTAQEKVAEAQLTNARVVCHDITHLPSEWTGKFQYIFSRSGLHDLPHPRPGLAELNRVLSDEGIMSALEPSCHSSLAANLDVASGPNLYAFSLMNCMPVSLSVDGSDGLGAVWGQEAATAMLEECGFKVTSVTDVLGDISMHLCCQKIKAKTLLSQGTTSSVETSEDGPYKAKPFSSILGEKVKWGLVSLALALGVEVGLFDIMVSHNRPMSCQEIAAAGKFKERYVREWLGSMVTSKIVSMDTSQDLYWVPRHLVSSLLRRGVPSSPSESVDSVPILSGAFYSLAHCFKLDGPEGIPSDNSSQFSKYIFDENSIWSVFLSLS
ncbi:uncharacterized protein LOC110974220 isoform X2 [Acanthaster planci]|uniref:Uncharacterized protein LOC110974220 isoform X2 n=1 Tax=Acanthaster planci TaxID=133434 RepID=A0A8B7XKR1_ACAPL|nr:uncharacterized protein LOC110974220 isoform X2 [Acanthaster planci]